MAQMTESQKDTQIVPIHLMREKKTGAQGATPRLWLKEPESQVEDRTILPARLCSCSDVCLAVVEDL